MARYRAEGGAAFEPRSRRPKTSPTAISQEIAGLIIELRKDLAGRGLDAGPQTICWHLEHHHRIRVSAATVSRYLTRAGDARAEEEAQVLLHPCERNVRGRLASFYDWVRP